jgi:hypothetical protein
MPFSVRWHYHPGFGTTPGWWQAQVITFPPLRWQFVALVEFDR